MRDRNRNIWLDGIMGVIIGDALGCPVQFRSREEIAADPVTEMRGHGTYDMPSGTWTDDGSMTLAAMDSIRECHGIHPKNIMYRFACWLTKGDYTPFGESFDIGNGTLAAITKYMEHPNINTCGGTSERDNGNGSLMRILPVCLFCCEQQTAGGMTDDEAIRNIHLISGLTHNHMRAKIACGLYYFLSRAVINTEGTLKERLQRGMDDGFAYYGKQRPAKADLCFYDRLRDLNQFSLLGMTEIRSSGYVVDTLEAAIWSLLCTGTFRDALLKSVNLGFDTDTVGAVCGGLAGLFYGYGNIPGEWLYVIKRREWIESMCLCMTRDGRREEDTSAKEFISTGRGSLPAQASADNEDFIYTEYTIERNGIALHLDCLKEENTDPEKHIFDSPD